MTGVTGEAFIIAEPSYINPHTSTRSLTVLKMAHTVIPQGWVTYPRSINEEQLAIFLHVCDV
jgi:hypothetical protein